MVEKDRDSDSARSPRYPGSLAERRGRVKWGRGLILPRRRGNVAESSGVGPEPNPSRITRKALVVPGRPSQ